MSVQEKILTEYGEYKIEYLKPGANVLSVTLHFPETHLGDDSRACWGFICARDDGKIVVYSHKLKKYQFNDKTGHFCECNTIMQLYIELADAHILVASEALEALFKHIKKLRYKIP